MSWYHRLFRRAKAEVELNEEIRFYLDQETQLRINRGESPEEAMRAARRDFGNVTVVKETTRQMWGRTLVDNFVRDLRYDVMEPLTMDELLSRSLLHERILATLAGSFAGLALLLSAVGIYELFTPERRQAVVPGSLALVG